MLLASLTVGKRLIMKLVLYSDIFEPITVIDLSYQYYEMLEKGISVSLPVIIPYTQQKEGKPSIITLMPKNIKVKDKNLLIVTVDDEELALLVKPSILAGQKNIRLLQK